MSRRILAGLLVVWFVVTAAAFSAKAVTSEMVVKDPLSGLALYGYDPVAYFLDNAALPGDVQYESRFGGLIWRFRSEANRAAFAHAPENFVPAFGGYDPLAVGEGIPLEGQPSLFAMFERKLFLFAREESREKFLSNPKNLADAAAKVWPAVQKKLVP